MIKRRRDEETKIRQGCGSGSSETLYPREPENSRETSLDYVIMSLFGWSHSTGASRFGQGALTRHL